jgi:hypothetical protein
MARLIVAVEIDGLAAEEIRQDVEEWSIPTMPGFVSIDSAYFPYDPEDDSFFALELVGISDWSPRDVLSQPLSIDDLKAFPEEEPVTGVVAMELGDIIRLVETGGLDAVLDELAERLCGSILLTDIHFQTVGCMPDGSLMVEVSGDPSLIISDACEDEAR